MTIALPSTAPVSATPRFMNYGRMTQPTAGGQNQYISRLGSRFAVQITLPPLNYDDAREWLAARVRAATEGDTVSYSWPQPSQASLGTPLVNGGSQLGASLICDGFTNGVSIPALAFFSFTVSGHSYLHTTSATGTADGSGNATLTIAPMLRVSPANNAALNFTTPTVEGFMDTGDIEWTLDLLRMTSLTFTILENK